MSKKGFTLMESIIAMAVLSIAIVAVFYIYLSVASIFTEELAESDILLDVNKPIEQMSKELRNTLEIVSSSQTSITFWHKDLNDDSIRDADETISYTWTGTPEGDINKTVGSSTVIVAKGIEDFSLTYNSSVDATLITISVTAKKNNKLGTLEASVQCRNL